MRPLLCAPAGATRILSLLLVAASASASAAAPAKPASKPAAAADALFDKYDADKNGVIDREEFKRIDADWHKAKAGKTKVDEDAEPVVDKGIRGDTGIRGRD